MTHEREPGSSNFRRYALPEVSAAARAEIAVFAEDFSLPPRIAEALQPESILPFAKGLPGPNSEIVSDYAKSVILSTDLIREDLNLLETRDWTHFDPSVFDAHGARRRNIRAVTSPQEVRGFWGVVRASGGLGMRQSHLLASEIDTFRFATFHYYNHEVGLNDRSITLASSEATALGIPTVLPESELARRLEELGRTDLSQEALDKRFEHFEAITQLELTRLLLHDTVDVERLGGRNNRAKETQEVIRGYLADDNLPAKLLGFDSIMQGFYSSRRGDHDVLMLLGNRVSRLFAGFDDLILHFNIVYYHKGLELPTRLEQLMAGGIRHDLNAHIAAHERHMAQESRKHHKEEHKTQLAELRVDHAALAEQAEAARKPWLLSSKARKDLGLADFNGCLLRGFTTASRESVKVTIPDNEVPTMTGILVKLQRMAEDAIRRTGSLDAAQAELQVALGIQAAIERQCETFYNKARALNASNLPHPELLRLQAHINQIVDQWPAFEKLMQEKWPRNGQTVAANIKALLEITS